MPRVPRWIVRGRRHPPICQRLFPVRLAFEFRPVARCTVLEVEHASPCDLRVPWGPGPPKHCCNGRRTRTGGHGNQGSRGALHRRGPKKRTFTKAAIPETRKMRATNQTSAIPPIIQLIPIIAQPRTYRSPRTWTSSGPCPCWPGSRPVRHREEPIGATGSGARKVRYRPLNPGSRAAAGRPVLERSSARHRPRTRRAFLAGSPAAVYGIATTVTPIAAPATTNLFDSFMDSHSRARRQAGPTRAKLAGLPCCWCARARDTRRLER